MRKKLLLFITIISLILTINIENLFAINFANRFFNINTLQYKNEKNDKYKFDWWYANCGWAEISKYAKIDDEHFWNAKIGSCQEFFRIGNFFSIALSSDLEVIVDKHSEVMNFNPRAMFLDFGFISNFAFSFGYFSLTYHHRYKNEIDIDPESKGRKLKYNSTQIKYISNYFNLYDSKNISGNVKLVMANDYFVYNDGYAVENLFDIISTAIFVEPLRYKDDWAIYFALGGKMNIYGEGSSNKDRHNADDVKFDGFAETGISFIGEGGKFYIFGVYQHLSDTGVPRVGYESNLVSIGIRFTPNV